jgi:hypothetical protein
MPEITVEKTLNPSELWKCIQPRRLKALKLAVLRKTPTHKVRQLVALEELRALISAEKKLPYVKGEIPDLLCDRLLLTFSRTYRTTRVLAQKLGIAVKPGLITNESTLIEFDPLSPSVTYSPVARDMHRLLNSIWSDDFKVSDVRRLSRKVTNTFHELNHAIMFRTLRPRKISSAGPQDIADYFQLVESLAVVRDLQLADELNRAGRYICEIGSLLRGHERAVEVSTKLDFDAFRSFTLTNFFFLKAKTKRQILKAFRFAGVTHVDHELMFINGGFIDETSPWWIKNYHRKHGGRFALPAAAARAPTLNFTVAPPAKLISSPRSMSSLYKWFGALYE